MEGYSIFSSSTNSSTSSPSNNTNFIIPFSLNQQVSSTSNNSLDHFDHDHHHHVGSLMMMMDDHQIHQPSMAVVQSDHHQFKVNNNDQNKRQMVIMENDNHNYNNHKMIKKGSLEKKAKKHRYAFQTRSQVDILDDGYRWRKYGQKAVKNNKFPRSYYRCTNEGCNVKKQVQRLSNDEGVIVTTYEGTHSHSIERSTDNFEHILNQMQIYTSY
ncbi:probable WRKY transcription factor 56 [Amaranthus tricolor]|uniref:probable WRKY transcription factor 56 n=1 Tax=Amaranthus tricolor TaxID=29722 RepID=UPI00258EC5E4|nr:probable WRKY transcription factor 56 [Amaranthus tricolor]